MLTSGGTQRSLEARMGGTGSEGGSDGVRRARSRSLASFAAEPIAPDDVAGAVAIKARSNPGTR